jgi:hypothetical protein
MCRWVPCTLLCAAALTAQQDAGTDALLARIQAKAAENLERMPDYVCTQTVERAHRATSKENFKLLDTLRLQVTLIGNCEHYAWLDARRFEDRELRTWWAEAQSERETLHSTPNMSFNRK